MDLVIRNGQVIDPATGFTGRLNIGVKDGRIAALTPETIEGKVSIDAAGLAVAPGFIDIHMHEDWAAGPGAMNTEILETLVRMGVTTAFGGNCGYSAYPLGAFFAALEQHGIPLNYLGQVGYITLREAIGLTDRYRAATTEEQQQIRPLLEQALAEGAAGLSFGFEYAPGVTTAEALAAAQVVACYPGRLLSAHFRLDTDGAVESVQEMAYISQASGVPMQVSHIGSCAGFPRTMEAALDELTRARAAGIDIMADCYPYEAFSTAIGSAVFDPGCFAKWDKPCSCILVAEGEYVGQYCDEALFARLREQAPETRVIGFVMHESEVVRALQHPLVMVGSDGAFHRSQGHPRGAGTFPRVLGRLVREQQALPLMDALAKMTCQPAARLGLAGKGRIAVGADADLVVFDPATILDRAEFTAPVLSPAGIARVIVGGRVAVQDGEIVDAKAGKVLRK